MKTSCIVVVLLACGIAGMAAGQSSSPQTSVNPTAMPAATPYAVVSRDANSQVWERTVYEPSPSGQMVSRKHSYTELSSGLNFLKAGQWVESKEQIEVLPQGGAAAVQGQHQAYFPGDIYQGQIELVTPDGQHLQSRPLGLSYDDGNNTVFIAELKDSEGMVVGNNQVIYPDAFTGFKADLVFTYTKSGFEQDIILRAQPPTPESLGLNPATARLQVLTEFFSPPQPAIQARKLAAQAGLSLTDQSLGFGAMQMVPGRAFLLGNKAVDSGAQVGKQWLLLDGRQFLVEEVPVDAIADGLATLPLTAMQPGSGKAAHTASRHPALPPQRLVKNTSQTMLLAKAGLPAQGFVLDYVTLNVNTNNFTFQGDTTYYISGSLNLSATNTFEGGAVIKYTNGASITLQSSSLNWQASAYRPVIFTARDDNSVGDTISGSTGSPNGYYYAQYALNFYVTPPATLSHFRIAYAQEAIRALGCTVNLYDGQLVNCQTGIDAWYATVNTRNLLFARVQAGFNISSSGAYVQNATFSSNATVVVYSSAGGAVALNNCILANVSQLTNSGYPYSTFSGDHNGFYNSPVFGTGQVTNNFYPFQTVGGGSYYLANGCAFTNAGTTNIDPVLLASLKQKTTYPPIVYTNITVTNATWTLQAPRDTNASPNLGYHYDPVDYAVSGVTIRGTLTLTNGVSVAVFNASSKGFYMAGGGDQLITTGTALVHNQICAYSSVQEQPVSWGSVSPGSSYFIYIMGSGVPNTMEMLTTRFTDFNGLGGLGSNYYVGGGSIMYGDMMGLNMRDCQVRLGFFHCLTFGGDGSITNQCVNNLFERASFVFDEVDGSSPVTFYNNLVRNGEVGLSYDGAYSWMARDNLFDHATFYPGSGVVFDHNAYWGTNAPSGSGGNDVVLTNFNYAAGPLGNYYQASTNLINKGSTTADKRGLYHYTTQTNQVKEANSIVDIGYHYVAVDGNGNPIDTNGNGVPDYLEDPYATGQFSITLIAPTNSTFYPEPATIPMQASVTGWSNLVTSVDFFRGSTHIVGTVNAPYQYSWPIVAAGAYSLTAVAHDVNSLSVTSTVVNITVTNFCGSY